jgi:hypothetical protein
MQNPATVLSRDPAATYNCDLSLAVLVHYPFDGHARWFPMPQFDDELLLNLAHFVNNPLTAIRNSLYLAGRLTSDPELLGYLDLANAEVSRIADSLGSFWSESHPARHMKAAA